MPVRCCLFELECSPSGCKAKKALYRVRVVETGDIIDSRDEAHARNRSDAGHRHQPLADRILSGELL